MVYTKRFVESATFARLPDKIKQHRVFKEQKRIKKVFPHFDLPNFSVPCERKVFVNGEEKTVRIVFSSDGITGLWDIATMSMRGVMSCMHWQNHHSSHLVGSIIDPCCGIIYMTDDTKTKYGNAMLKRALVRFCASKNDSKGFFIVDRIYTKTHNINPMAYDNRDPISDVIAGIFVKALKKKTKLPVYNVYGRLNDPLKIPSYELTYIPMANVVGGLIYDQRSLIDCSLPYSSPRNESGSACKTLKTLID